MTVELEKNMMTGMLTLYDRLMFSAKFTDGTDTTGWVYVMHNLPEMVGRRIFKKVYNGEILEKHLSFVYDGYKLIEERNALDNDAAVRKYVWQPEALDRDVPLTVCDAASEKTYYYHTDANKNVNTLMKKRDLFTTTTVTTIPNSVDGFQEILLKSKGEKIYILIQEIT